MEIDNYEKFKEMLREKRKDPLLLHCCCAPCSSQVLDILKERFDITIFYYNPNTYPEDEFVKRLDEFKKLGFTKIIVLPYDHQEFVNIAQGMENEKEGGKRCFACYKLRLEATAKYASLNNFPFFTTTLSISPYKNSNKINEIGQELANKYGLKFVYSNFKKEDGYKKSIVFSKQLALYRQEYCGCEFSLKERKNQKKIERD